MPNTLAHIGIQGLATRGFIKDADFKWVLVGCIIPDIPWIMRRIVSTFFDVNPYDIRLFAIVQSSLFFCIILSLALATFSNRFWRTFFILSLNSFFHLILDAMQIKWGNGVHLFAPFDWSLTSFGFFWPENLSTHLLTGFGFLYFWFKWHNDTDNRTDIVPRPMLFSSVLFVYIFLPFLFLSFSENADNHFINTLRSVDGRQGKYIEIDRAGYSMNDRKRTLRTFATEGIMVEGLNEKEPAVVSVKGVFLSPNKIRVSEYHIHSVAFRDSASYLGLLLIVIYWICSFFRTNQIKKAQLNKD